MNRLPVRAGVKSADRCTTPQLLKFHLFSYTLCSHKAALPLRVTVWDTTFMPPSAALFFFVDEKFSLGEKT